MNKDLIVDMWFGDNASESDKIDCFWSDCDCVYRGNFYKFGRAIGDYTAKSLQAIETFWSRTHAEEVTHA